MADKRIADQLRQLQTHEAKAERKRETRRKIVIGAIVRAAQTSQTDISLRWLDEQIQALTRPDDRALFGLDAEPSAGAAEADKAEPAATRPAPITARQKQLLARLVEEHPELAQGVRRRPRRARAGKARQGEGDLPDPSDARPRQRAGAAR